MTLRPWLLAACLLGLTVFLMLVGLVSGTPVRHLIQAIPGVVVLLCMATGSRWTPQAAFPLFVFWFFIMALIWLFLLGLARIVTGTFTPAEVILTLAIGASCAVGAWSAFRLSPASMLSRAGFFVLFLGLQVLAMWVSLQPQFNSR